MTSYGPWEGRGGGEREVPAGYFKYLREVMAFKGVGEGNVLERRGESMLKREMGRKGKRRGSGVRRKGERKQVIPHQLP